MLRRNPQEAGERARYGIAFAIAAFVFLLMSASAAPAGAQRLHYAHPPNAAAGEKVYKDGCIACHGPQGKGNDPKLTVFLRPDTWPDFTRCDQTTPEPDSAWKAVIIHGGPNRGFSQIMPAFGDLLTDEQINDVIAYMRAFCTNQSYPRGELNLPRALVTEKAFPEKEEVVSTELSASGAPSWTTDVIHEQAFAGRNQLEIDVPVNYADQDHQWTAGTGDITVGLKREMFYSLRTGSILSLQGGFLLPTGDSKRGFGAGTATFEPFLAFDQLFPENTFIQFQAGGDLTFDEKKSPRSLYFNTAVGQSWAPDHGLGRLYSPMVEFIATRDLEDGASTDWDIIPQMQVTISKRQHVRGDIGVRAPANNTSSRGASVVFYLLWDWADGKLNEGWR